MGRQCVLYITRISIHAPAKGATSHVVKISLSITYFNPRSREGSDLYNAGLTWRSAKFQSTLPRRERRRRLYKHAHYVQISIHAPAKGATTQVASGAEAKAAFQSTLPRRERRCSESPSFCIMGISIHAPAKGATVKTGMRTRNRKFQSTLPRRERPKQPILNYPSSSISIHAPAKGATVAQPGNAGKSEQISIHAPAKGATSLASALLVAVIFQSTLPRRERRRTGLKSIPGRQFQSTLPRRERHNSLIKYRLDALISIHAPAKGATIYTFS